MRMCSCQVDCGHCGNCTCHPDSCPRERRVPALNGLLSNMGLNPSCELCCDSQGAVVMVWSTLVVPFWGPSRCCLAVRMLVCLQQASSAALAPSSQVSLVPSSQVSLVLLTRGLFGCFVGAHMLTFRAPSFKCCVWVLPRKSQCSQPVVGAFVGSAAHCHATLAFTLPRQEVSNTDCVCVALRSIYYTDAHVTMAILWCCPKGTAAVLWPMQRFCGSLCEATCCRVCCSGLVMCGVLHHNFAFVHVVCYPPS